MKKIILFASTIGLLVIQSCTDENVQADNQVQIQTSLAGQVYGWTNPPLDTTKCGQLQLSNDAFPKLLFLDDSTFIQTIPTSCGDIGACSRYYCGKYKIDDKEITLTFNPKIAVYHIKSKNLASPYVESENSDLKIIKHLRLNCQNTPCFVECNVQGNIMVPKADTLTNYISFMKDEKIWDTLF